MLIILLSAIIGNGFSQELKNINLPDPQTTGGMPLRDALMVRQSGRVYSDQAIEMQQIADLLWAAFGINRPASGKRTAPSARNFQEISLYVVLPAGIYKWDAKANQLIGVLAGDHRSKIGTQPFVGTAPMILLLVADHEKYGEMTKEKTEFYSGIDAGYISQNIYLFCASEKLSTVVLGSIDRVELGKLLKLPETQKVVVGQPVGWPGEE